MKQAIRFGILAAGLIASMLLTGAAQATAINGNSTTGLASPVSTILFTEATPPNNTLLTNEYAGLGVASFSGLYYNGCASTCITTPPTGSKPDIGNFANEDTSVFTGTQDIKFTSGLDGAAFQFASNGGSVNFIALLGGSIVEQFIGNGSNWGYYGFTNIVFDEIQIVSPSALLIDNLQLGNAVPVPAPLALLGIGLLAMGATRRRAKQ